MKKLMFAAVIATVGTSAFSAPLVYNYKASVKHMYLKEVSVTLPLAGGKVPVYRKFQKNANLRGYLVVDADGATSQAIQVALGSANVNGAPAAAADMGRNRAFLIVENTKAENEVRTAKIMPAVLEAKWIDTKFKMNGVGTRVPSNDLAEGYLFVGGDAVAPLREKLEMVNNALITHGVAANPVIAPAANAAGMAMIQDYLWTSVYLFGKYNGPEWFVPDPPAPQISRWQNAQTAIDGNFVPAVQVVTYRPAWAGVCRPFFHDSWMNGAGFGKFAADRGGCCGMSWNTAVLDSLSGNLKGGLFLCTENGIQAETSDYQWFNYGLGVWEEQFFCARDNGAFTWTTAVPGDLDQVDLWQDGNYELNTTDCLFGSWSIKLIKSGAPSVDLTGTELVAVASTANINGTALANANDPVESADGLLDLLATIKGCGLRLDSGLAFIRGNTAGDTDRGENCGMTPSTQFDVRFLTPGFCYYYGLANFQ